MDIGRVIEIGEREVPALPNPFVPEPATEPAPRHEPVPERAPAREPVPAE